MSNMKKVIFEDVKNFYFKLIDDNSIVGILIDGKKSFILETKDGFSGIKQDSLSLKHSWSRNTVSEYVSELNKNNSVDFFVFDSIKELYKWLSE